MTREEFRVVDAIDNEEVFVRERERKVGCSLTDLCDR